MRPTVAILAQESFGSSRRDPKQVRSREVPPLMFRAILWATAFSAAAGDEAGLRGFDSDVTPSQKVSEQSDVERLLPAAVEKVTILQQQGFGNGYGQQAGGYGGYGG